MNGRPPSARPSASRVGGDEVTRAYETGEAPRFLMPALPAGKGKS